MEQNKYENIIKEYSAEQLILEASIVNEQSNRYYAQKKAIEAEFDRRRKEERKG